MARGLKASLGAVLIALLAVPAMAQNVPLPTPAPQPKTGSPSAVPPPPNSGARPVPPGSIPNASTAAPSPFRPSAAVGKPGETTAFDANQRALVDKVSNYLSGLRTLVGDFVKVGPSSDE